jgi:hypothetical protein
VNAAQLASVLRAQATPPPHRIRLDATMGIDGLDQLVIEDLRRPDGVLELGVTGPDAIPSDPPPTFAFPVTVPVGADGFLGLGGAGATLTLVVGTTIDLQLTIDLPDAWVFSTSYPELAGLPYDALDLASCTLTLSTGGPGTAAEGLRFRGDLALAGPFETVASLLGLSERYELTGPIAGSGAELTFDLEAGFGLHPPPTVGGVVTLDGAGAGVALAPLLHGAATDRLVLVALVATVAFENVEGDTLALDLRATMPITQPDARLLTLSVAATPGFQATLGTLGELLLGQSWDALFAGPLQSIGDVLNVFGLRSYALTLPVTGGAPAAMTLDVGTIRPWAMWDGGPTLDLSVLWNVLWMGSGTVQQLELTALFTYPPDRDDGITFALTIASDLHIAGSEQGELPMALSALNDLVFGGNVIIPEDLLRVEVENFDFAADVNAKEFTIGATASASVGLFGTEVLGIRDMAMSVSFDAGDDSGYTGTLDGEVFLGSITFQADAVISDQPGVDTVFTLHLVDETVGSMLNHVVHLVDPTFDVSLQAPWDALLDVSLDAFVLTVNVTQRRVALDWRPQSRVDLGFLTVDGIELEYASATGGRASSTRIAVSGTFLGVPFPQGDDALAWDPVNESPPAVPGQGASLFDLQYAGLGQHIGLAGDPQTMDAVMDQLIATASPIQPGALPPLGTDLVFQDDSSWLIGAQFTVMDTVSIKAVFNDPNLYGVVIALSGEKAEVFAGLRFEILYRKVSDSLGLYHVELTLPDAMRHLEFGEVSVTLPIVAVDIYTNGSFRVDFGFPVGLDFSRSFSLQLFPFVGYGGFYFAMLEGGTSSRVPQIVNGTFSPVLEFGLALSLGVGKDIDEGILKGGMSITVVGILEGVLAWFNPTDSSPAETYYSVKGTIAVTGHLYASVDFGIIQASVDVTAYISATLVVESHEPIFIEATASVSVRVSLKIVFFRIHLSFSATVDASFTIGSASATPWVVQRGARSSDGPRRLLRGQRTVHAPTALAHRGRFKAARRQLVAARSAEPITSWPAVCVLAGGPQTIGIDAVTGFTKADAWAVASATRASGTTTVTTFAPNGLLPGDQVTLAGLAEAGLDGTFIVASTPSTTTLTVAQAGPDLSAGAGGTATAAAAEDVGEAVILLSAASSIDPDAQTLAAHRTVAGVDPATLPFNLLMQAMLGWGIYVETHRPIASIARAAGTATIETVTPHGFLPGTPIAIAGAADASFDGSFTIASVPTATTFTVAQGGADGTTAGGEAVSALVSADQLEDLRSQLSRPETVAAAFDYDTLTDFLAANLTFDVRHPDTSQPASGALFPMFPELRLTDTAGTSIDFSTQTPVDDAYVEKVRAYFQLLAVQQAAREGSADARAGLLGESMPSMATVLFAQYFTMLMSAGAKAAIDLLAAYPYTTPAGSDAQPQSIGQVGAAIGDEAALLAEPLRIVAPNQDAAVLEPGARIDLPDVVCQVRSGQTLEAIAAGLAAAGALAPDGSSPYAASDLLAANLDAPIFQAGVALPLAGLPYTTIAEDTVNLVATRLLVRLGGATLLGRLSDLQPAVDALVAANGGLDPNAALAAGTPVRCPDGSTYIAVAGDTLTRVAAYGLAPAQSLIALAGYAAALQAANPWLPAGLDTPIGADKTVLLAALSRPFAAGDTVASLARTLMTTADAIGTAIAALGAPALSPLAVLHAPLTCAVSEGDTFAAIAAKLDVTLTDLADQAAQSTGLFATGAQLTIADVTAIDPVTLMDDLLASGQWNTAAGMASRFMLSGLRLPDPTDPAFAALTPAQLLDPRSLAGIRTKPAFRLSGQQYPLGDTIPPGYEVTLAETAGVPWITLDGSGDKPLTYALTDDERAMFAEVATTPVPDDLQTLTRLELFRMAPPRVALAQHLAWQAAVVPVRVAPAGAAAGNPSVWTFPDTLIAEIERTTRANDGAPLEYELVTAKHTQAGAPVSASDAERSAWATIVNITVSLPAVDGPAPSVSNACVLDGADDTGAELLAQLHAHMEQGHGATLYLLYPPDPASGNASGMASDALDPASTVLLKTNLSTVTNPRQALESRSGGPVAHDDYAASIADAQGFVALLWEASITRSGGFYLNYATADGGAPLPASAFGGTSEAQLMLLAVPDDDPGLLPWHNCAVVGDTIDPGASSVFVQPTTHSVQPGEDLQSVADAHNARWGTHLGPGDVAALNASVPQVLAVGENVQLPGGGEATVAYGDTFASVAAGHGTTPAALGTANATAPILALGAQLQFADGVLQAATTVPAGVAGFELTRVNPDAAEAEGALEPPQTVARLFNLVGWSLSASDGFTASGAGLPTTPSGPLVLGPDGLSPIAPDGIEDGSWYYQQAFAVAPFGTSQAGSASPALPPAAADPYNGVGTTGGALNEATVALTLLDVYGNAQPLAAPAVSMPVGYYDDLAGPVSWPSLAMSYLVVGPPTAIAIAMTMQQTRYIPSASVAVPAALSGIAADLDTYTRVYYQLVQPDVAFSLQTSLVLDSDGITPLTDPLDKVPLLSFAYSAWVYLRALSTTTAVRIEAGAEGLAVASPVADYGVTAEQLFAANQGELYSALFGAEQIVVPQLYATIEGDTIAGIAAAHGLSVDGLALANDDVSLNAGTILTAGTRTVTAAPRPAEPEPTPASLADVAAGAHTAATDVATANATTAALLVAGTPLTLGTATTLVGGDDDTLANVALRLDGTVEQVALANPAVPLLRPNVTLSVRRVLVRAGDSLGTLATIPGVGTVAALATANAGVANAFAPATSLLVGPDEHPKPVEPSDTLASYAAASGIPVEALGAANADSGRFAAGATITIPGALDNGSGDQCCTYAAPAGTTLEAIAGVFGVSPAAIVALNPDLPGLLSPAQQVTDSATRATVTTGAGETFQSLVVRFAAEGAAVPVDQLAADVAGQEGLVAPGSLWICPPMRGGHGDTLRGLARYYNADPTALATANAATLGLLSTTASITVGGATYVPKAHDTLNSLVNRFATLGVTTTLDDVIAAALDAPGLVAPTAAVLPVPPPSPGLKVPVDPHVAEAVFPLTVSLTESRDPALVDPDFADEPSIVRSTLTLAPNPDPGSTAATLALTDFANELESALPGMHVATGDPAGESDPASASAIWLVSFGAPDLGPTLEYRFDPGRTAYYALPPLSSSQLGGDVDVRPYVTGQDPPFQGAPRPRSFRSVDLDGWLDSFLGAVDLFLSPAYAVPAYALDPDATTAIVQAKEALARRIADRVEVVLEGDAGAEADAIEALYQAMLTQLSSAFTVSTLVQVPVTVAAGTPDAATAPRLSGQLAQASSGGTAMPQAYSFSTAKVPLATGASSATFLLTVKAPADHREVALELDYVITALELPQPGETIGDYQGSCWLTFVNPVETQGGDLGLLQIPVPLRAYPGPVTLAAQTATQSVPRPAGASDLLPWDLAFAYQHDDAEQDTPLVEIAFNAIQQEPVSAGPTDAVVEQVFAALAWFTDAYPALKADLALLTTAPAGTSSPTANAAVRAFCELVEAVSAAFTPPPQGLAESFQPPEETLYYQLQKEQTIGGDPDTLTSLVVSSVNPTDGTSPQTPLWPSTVIATYGGSVYPLALAKTTPTSATFSYPPDAIPASADVGHRFVFEWPTATGTCAARATPLAPALPDALAAPQVVQMLCVNVLSEQSARAGVSIWRNLELVPDRTTNGAFVYRTPVTVFPSSALPSIVSSPEDPIAIGASPTAIGEALGRFLQDLVTAQNTWAAGETLSMRLTGGYSYAVTSSGSQMLGPVVPIFLVASVDFDPLTDWDWSRPESFVSQVAAVVDDWIATRQPGARDRAAILFDLTVYAGGEQAQPLIHAAALRYGLGAGGSAPAQARAAA